MFKLHVTTIVYTDGVPSACSSVVVDFEHQEDMHLAAERLKSVGTHAISYRTVALQ